MLPCLKFTQNQRTLIFSDLYKVVKRNDRVYDFGHFEVTAEKES